MTDTAASHLRNALTIIELLNHDGQSTASRALVDIESRITSALALIERHIPARIESPLRLDLLEMEQTVRELHCPCGDMNATDCAGECGR